MLAETPWYHHPHTYRCAWLPFPAWQPLCSIHDHPGLSLSEEGEEKISVPECPVVSPVGHDGGYSATRPAAQQGDEETLGSPRHQVTGDARG